MDGGDWIATLYCTHINSDSAEDCKKACNFGYTDALEYAFQKSNSSHNLVVINSAIINGDASCESVEFAFKRMHCILRDTVSQAFGALSPNNSIDMYYDFQAMDNKDSAMIKRFAYDFENGEIQIDKIGNDQAWYIHMIPCEPGSVSGQFQHSESSADNTVMR